MKIVKCHIPSSSLLQAHLPGDYADSFCVTSSQEIPVTPDDLLVSFWTDMPGWVDALFRIRGFLVRFVGLKGEKGDNRKLEECIRNGGKYSFIEIPQKDENETVMLMKDSHLNAYISVRIEPDKCHVYANTLVSFNNKLGVFYFSVIKPFHCVVVKQMVKRMVRKALAGSAEDAS